MGSSGGGSANPAYLSQGTSPIPNLPIAGQGAPNDNPRNFGSFQNFLPDIPAAGQGPAPLAHGLTAEMLQYKSPQGVTAPSSSGGDAAAATTASGTGTSTGTSTGSSTDIESMKQQIATLQAQAAGNGQFGAARGTLATAGSPYNSYSGSPTDGPKFG